ncbi:MAG: hypothetical protein ABL999_13690 [Pyrinomonadaceae bacterium]
MRICLVLSTFLSVLLLASIALAQSNYDTYSNARFEYDLKYPANIFTPQEEAQNGDGRVFLSKDGTARILVWGQYNALFDTLKKAYFSDLKEHPKGVTYKALLKDGYVISGVRDKKIFYQKTMLNGQDGDGGAVFATFLIEYKATDKDKFDPIVRKIAASFKFN